MSNPFDSDDPSSDEIRDALIDGLGEADVFAAVALKMPENSDGDGPEVISGRAHSDELEDDDAYGVRDVMAMMRLLETEMDDLKMGSPFDGADGIASGVSVVGLTEDEAERMGIQDMLEDLLADDGETDIDEAMDDGTSIDIE